MIFADQTPLGKQSVYSAQYDPGLLYPLERATKRAELGLVNPLPFDGLDIWNAYELSWLESETHKPRIALVELYFPCHSPYMVESKSLKLYFNAFNQSVFESPDRVKQTIVRDLSQLVKAPVGVVLKLPPFSPLELRSFSGVCLDDLPVKIHSFDYDPTLLQIGQEKASEALFSDLLKSNCLITQQPDWASVYIVYEGWKIDHPSLLRYIISYRQHDEFGEQCAERIFTDILRHCKPEKLSVYLRYTRRGGIDINPFRSNFQQFPDNVRNARQ